MAFVVNHKSTVACIRSLCGCKTTQNICLSQHFFSEINLIFPYILTLQLWGRIMGGIDRCGLRVKIYAPFFLFVFSRDYVSWSRDYQDNLLLLIVRDSSQTHLTLVFPSLVYWKFAAFFVINLMVFYSIIQTVILPWEWPRVTSGTLRLLPPRRTRCGRSPLLADSGTKGDYYSTQCLWIPWFDFNEISMFPLLQKAQIV